MPLAKAFPKKILLACLLTKENKPWGGISLSKAFAASEHQIQVLAVGSSALSGAEVDLHGMLLAQRSRLQLSFFIPYTPAIHDKAVMDNSLRETMYFM